MREAVVSVAVATVWAEPGAVRDVDAPALTAPSDVRRWAAGLDASGREALGGRVRTQALLGEPVLIRALQGAWAEVVLPSQPSRHDPEGYPGWIPLGQLSPASPGYADPATASHVVNATATALRDEPDGDVTMPGVVIGTRLHAAGAPSGEWLPVRVPGAPDPLWARLYDLVPTWGMPETDPGWVALETAARLLDVRYVWGGMSPWGVDCSGLTHLAWRRQGVRIPRDAADQAAALPPVPPGEERPGDLYVFARTGEPVHHVGLVAPPEDGRSWMLHACGDQGRVVLEAVTGEREATRTAVVRPGG